MNEARCCRFRRFLVGQAAPQLKLFEPLRQLPLKAMWCLAFAMHSQPAAQLGFAIVLVGVS